MRNLLHWVSMRQAPRPCSVLSNNFIGHAGGAAGDGDDDAADEDHGVCMRSMMIQPPPLPAFYIESQVKEGELQDHWGSEEAGWPMVSACGGSGSFAFKSEVVALMLLLGAGCWGP